MKPVFVCTLAFALAYSVQADSIFTADFTDSGTYSTGSLGGQDGWAISGNGIGVTATTGAAFDGFEYSVNSAATSHSIVAAGETYTSSITFSYDDNSGGSGGGPHLAASIWNGTTPSSDSQLSMHLRRTGAAYRLTMADNWGNTYGSFGFNQSGTSQAASLGTDQNVVNDPTTDELRVSLALTAGADTNSWTAVGTLFNVTTGSNLLTHTVNSVSFGAAAGANVYGGMTAGQSDGNQNIANRVATSFSFGSTVIPEPSSLALMGLGLVALFKRRLNS